VIDQEKIVKFVTAVETKKNFKRCPDKIFRHMISEMGELDGAIHLVDQLNFPDPDNMLNMGSLRRHLSKKVGEELLDIIFLACYMADIYGVDLNALIPARMKAIAEQYGVKVPQHGRR
jgi:NTP pyrophosphatase (non-canonical NTP hydrolase)